MPSQLWSRLQSSKHYRAVLAASVGLISLFFLYRYFGNSASFPSTTLYEDQVSGSRISQARRKSLIDVQNSTLGFEKILAINLPERTGHHDSIVLFAALSNISVDFIDGVHADTIMSKVLPPDHPPGQPTPWMGAWRAHINAISRVVEQGWTSALIIEDDIDWDIRLKDLLQDFAIAFDYLTRSSGEQNTWLHDISANHVPVASPYGDGWDVLWLGHCGMWLEDNTPIVLQKDDSSVPELQHLRSWDLKAENPLKDYPPHTRVVSKGVHGGTCSLAYAVSQAGARKLLYSLGLQHLNAAFDLMLREWCEGMNGHEKHACIGALPQLFDHHRPAGATDGDSDIGEVAGEPEVRDKAYTRNIRWSVKMNMEKLLRGETDYNDQYPDTE